LKGATIFVEDNLVRLDKVTYLEHGTSDEEGYQIFTPEFIVNGMVDAIGKKEVLDFSKTILEPTSGDGAFTCRILIMRLKKIKENFAALSLKALSTIYSIEMNEELITKQRNNIYTIMCDYAGKKKITDEKYFECLKDIILSNFIWGMTNTGDSLFFLGRIEIAFKMPYEEGCGQVVDIYSWRINDDLTYEKILEDVEV